jgi:hypothetical protein
MQSCIRLREADIQDLSPFIEEFACRYGSCHKEMDLLAKRFSVPLSETVLEESSSISSRAYAFLHYINGTVKFLDVIDYVLQKDFDPKKVDMSKYSRILVKYGFEITEKNGKLKLTPVPSGVLQQERKAKMSWLEQHASKDVIRCLKDAKDNFGKGRFDYVLDDCRKALEALTNGKTGFSNSLTELVNEKIILQGDTISRKIDAEVIRAVYGFNSTLGSHTSAGAIKPDIEQAFLGLCNTETCIHFLVKRLEAARKSGKKFKYWA